MKNQIPVWAIIVIVVAVLGLVTFFGFRALGPNSSGGRNLDEKEAENRMKQQMNKTQKDMMGAGSRPNGGPSGQGGYGRPGGQGGYGSYGRPGMGGGAPSGYGRPSMGGGAPSGYGGR
jgi:hypothetical protein